MVDTERKGGEFPGTNMIDYPFPLRDDCTAHLVLPRDLTHADVNRLTAFLMALTERE